MGGIAGIFHCGTIKPVDPARVERMIHSLVHRGPDGQELWTAPGVGLARCGPSSAETRDGSRQLYWADRRCAIVLDGEIRNWRALRKDLQERDEEFRTSGEIEVILAAYRRWGADCLKRLAGSFALAIFDRAQRTLLLARDQLGKKPLFMARASDGSVLFSSELKGLLVHPLLRCEIDPLALEDYMTWGFVPDHRSILRGVEKLPAGHFRLLRHNAPPAPAECYWSLSFAERRKSRARDLEAQFLHRLRQAVTAGIRADKQPGVLLTDDIASAAVLALVAEVSIDPVTTCSIGTNGGAEAERVQQVAQLFGSAHHSRQLAPLPPPSLDTLASIFDEPFADMRAVTSWHLCQLAREHVAIAVSAEGADAAMVGGRVRKLAGQRLGAQMLGWLAKAWPGNGTGPLAANRESALATILGTLPPDLRQSLYGDQLRRDVGEYRGEQPFLDLLGKAPSRSPLDRAQYAELLLRLPAGTLARMDRMGLAAGLCLSEPLLDHRLVEFIATMPGRLRMRPMRDQYLLCKAMQNHLPRAMLLRPERGGHVPIGQWLRGPLREQVQALAKDSAMARGGWFDARAIGHMVEAHLADRKDHSCLLWRLLMLDRSLAWLGIAA